MPTTDRPLRVLVVEDNPTLRRAFSVALSNDPGIVTDEAGDLAEAVAAAKSIHRPVLLVDLGLPGAAGTEAVSVLRATAPEATLVVITGDGTAGPDAIAAGAHEVIVKGSAESHGAKLTEAVRRAVARHDAALLLDPLKEIHREQRDAIKEAKRMLTPALLLGLMVTPMEDGRAAERMRADNAAIAIEWASQQDGSQ